MKKLFGFVTAVAMVLMVCIFTGCAHEPQEYTGRYWNTEYVSNVSEEDLNKYYNNQTEETKTAWRESWPEIYSSTYVKKTGLTTPDLTSYMKTLMPIDDSEINSDLEKIGTIYSGYYYKISKGEGKPYKILYLTEQK